MSPAQRSYRAISKFDALVRTTAFTDHRIQTDIRGSLRVDPPVETCRRFATRLACLVGFQGTFDHLGNRTIFPASQPVSQIPCLGATDRELWCSHCGLLYIDIDAERTAIKMADAGLPSGVVLCHRKRGNRLRWCPPSRDEGSSRLGFSSEKCHLYVLRFRGTEVSLAVTQVGVSRANRSKLGWPR